MKTVIIGGTGHIGSFLVRMLAEQGHEVLALSTGRTGSHVKTDLKNVKFVHMQYSEMLASGEFASMLRDERADAVVDILQGDTQKVYDACRDSGVDQLVVCGSVWMFGRPKVVPTPETAQTECEFASYRERYADMLETAARAKADGYSFSAVMPPNICGPGKIPLDCLGGRSIEAHRAHQRGEKVIMPFPGTNLIGPCDAEDVARGFLCALMNKDAASGEIFNVGSAYALTAEKFVQTYADIYGVTIPIEYVSVEKYISEILPDPGANFHFVEHMCPDISKISSCIGYKPAYTPEQTMERAVKWMYDQKLLI